MRLARSAFSSGVPNCHRAAAGLRVLAGVVVLAMVAPGDSMAQGAGTPPNIVLIVSDYMGYSDIEPYGARDVRTPSLSALARGGVRFTSYYAASPVCGPSRAALLSGRYPARVQMEANVAPDFGGLSFQYGTLVRELKAAGYRTGMIGKWHLGRGPGYSPRSHGFDTFYGFHDWTIGYHTHLNQQGQAGLYRGEEIVSEEGYLTELLSNEASRFIEESAGSPFFLYLAYNAGLPPYQGPDLPESEWQSGWNVSEARREDYIAMVEAMDEGIGRVMSKLDELDLAENTLVIYTYDHGGQDLVNSDPLFHGFGSLWEGGIRVPLLVRWPARIERGQDVDRPSIAMDLTATMLAVAGRETASLDLDGTNLLPLLVDGTEVPADTLYWRFQGPGGIMRAVRRDNWKFLVDRDASFLFDLDDDIGERHNLYSSEPELAEELRQAFMAWSQSLTTGAR